MVLAWLLASSPRVSQGVLSRRQRWETENFHPLKTVHLPRQLFSLVFLVVGVGTGSCLKFETASLGAGVLALSCAWESSFRHL